MVLCATTKACEVEDFRPPERTTEEHCTSHFTEKTLRNFKNHNHPASQALKDLQHRHFFGNQNLPKTILDREFNPTLGHQDLIPIVVPSAKLLKLTTVSKEQHVKHCQQNQIFLARFLTHSRSQDNFSIENFDETD